MTTKNNPRTTIKLNLGDKAKLQEIAKQLGITQGRGNTPDEGSVSGLMKAIAAGELVVRRNEVKNDK